MTAVIIGSDRRHRSNSGWRPENPRRPLMSKAARKKRNRAKRKKADIRKAKKERKSNSNPNRSTPPEFEIEGVTQRPAIALLHVTGAVELNPEKTEMATPLVGGRIENVFYGVGDYVNQGAILAVISSPQLAEMHGKMQRSRKPGWHSRKRNLARVQKSENRVSILQAKAKLDEAEATLRRTKRLIELGAGAGKDLIAAETNYKTAKADYDFQSNISLNKEIQEAQRRSRNRAG